MIKDDSRILYIDPWKVSSSLPGADIIFITHDHYDHYSEGDIRLLSGESTRIVAPRSVLASTDVIAPGESITLKGITVEAVPAYNMHKKFHPKEKGWVGYIIEINDKRIYHTGDTDRIPEMINLPVDLVLIPVGGTYTMNAEEASGALEDIQAREVIPIHFGDIVGTRNDAEKLARIAKKKVRILDPGESFTLV